jgi:hypothetical protein
MSRKMWLLIFLVLILTIFSGNVYAKQNITKNTKILHEGQITRDVFLFGEDGVISGTVKDEVVVINGDLILTGTADIKDRVFIVGGKLTREPGAKVGEGIFHVNLKHQTLNSLLLGFGAFIAIELGKLCLGLLAILASVTALFLVKSRVNRAKAALQTNFIKTGLLGLLATIGSTMVVFALTITIWGIPVAILLGAIIIVLLSIGMGALSLIFGELLLRSFNLEQNSFIQVLVGSLFIVALSNFPVFGALWGIMVFIFAMGALALSLLPGRTEVDV